MPNEQAETRIDSRENGLADFIDFAHPDLFYKAQVFARFLQDGRSRGFATYIRRVRNYDRGAAVVDAEVQHCDRRVVMMASADYLGFARHPAVVAAAQQAIGQFGVSTCSVPIMAGATSLHRELEVALARFVGAEDCVLFPTGLAANVGTIQALCTHRNSVVLDKSVHYSILDGVRLSGARWRSFRHSDPEHLARVLEAVRSENRESGILVVIEGIYGIDGDIAPIPELVEICGRFGARLLVDDAHATGVVGFGGRGSSEFHRISEPPSLIMGSLSKAFGSFGGWLATSQQVADYLRYYARTIAFSVGLPPSCAGAAMTALTFLKDDPQYVAQLRTNISLFREGLLALGIRNAERSASAIMSVPVGSEAALRDIARELFRRGVYAEPLPFPAVPHGQERIRFRVSAAHTADQLHHVLGVIDRVLDEFAVCSFKSGKSFLHTSLTSHSEQRDTDSSSGIERRVGDRVTDPACIAEFSCRVAAARSYPIPWLHRDDYDEILRGCRLRIRSQSSFCHFIAENHGDPIASLCTTLEPQISLGSSCSTGAIGHMHWMPGAEETIGNLLSMATEWLVERGVSLVIAPVQSPLLVLGGGISCKPDPAVYPMLQPHLPSVGGDILRSLGFDADIALPHWRLDLSRAASTLQAHIPKGIALRSLDKTQLRREIAAILPVINRSLASLPYCDPLMMEELYSAANEFRNLIIDGLWKIAEFGNRPVGFIGALPDINEALVEAAGAAGPADIHNSSLVLAKTKRASLVWLAIDPDFRDLGIGFGLLKALYSDLRTRGFTEVWHHWEFVDGDLRAEAFLPSRTAVIDEIEYRIFRRGI